MKYHVTFLFATLGLSYFLVSKAVRFRKKYFTFKPTRLNNDNTVIVNTLEQCVDVVSELKRKCANIRVLGMDCEWRPENNPGPHRVALLQLATLDGYCSLIRLSNIGHIPDCLAEILYDKTIIKTGVAVTNDARKLLKDYGVRSRGCLDVRYMAKNTGLIACSLGKMSHSYLGVKLDKDWRVSCSDWEAPELDDRQITYAAYDALASVYLFEFFNKLYMGKKYPWWKRVLWSEYDYQCKIDHHWHPYVDIGFSEKAYKWHEQNIDSNAISTGGSSQLLNRNSTSSRKPPPNSRTYSVRTDGVRRKPLYDNIFVQAPDSKVLFTCDQKKASWYLNKDIAFVVSDDPLTIRLKFEPAGRKGDGEGYYSKVKSNICVVCGSINLMRRKNIVPQEYRRYFPNRMKEHSSHDVLLLCDFCHYKCQYYDRQLRTKLAEQCDAPLSTSVENSKVFQLHDLMQVRSAARALLKSAETIPEERRKELESTVRNYLKNLSTDDDGDCYNDSVQSRIDHFDKADDCLEISRVTLEKLSNMNTSVENLDYEPHGAKVVEYYMRQGNKPEDGVNLLEKVWRNHFVKCMAPKFLPELWSVDYKHVESD